MSWWSTFLSTKYSLEILVTYSYKSNEREADNKAGVHTGTAQPKQSNPRTNGWRLYIQDAVAVSSNVLRNIWKYLHSEYIQAGCRMDSGTFDNVFRLDGRMDSGIIDNIFINSTSRLDAWWTHAGTFDNIFIQSTSRLHGCRMHSGTIDDIDARLNCMTIFIHAVGQ